MSVIALTCQYELEVNGDKNVRSQPGEKKGPEPVKNVSKGNGKGKEKEKEKEKKQEQEAITPSTDAITEVPEESQDPQEEVGEESESSEEEDVDRVDEITSAVEQVDLDPTPPPQADLPSPHDAKHDGEDSDGGDWINPSNVSKHRSKDLGLVPTGTGSDQSPLAAACMTGDYAVQNVLLSMGLGLVGEQGKRINKVKSWVLRCHACFK